MTTSRVHIYVSLFTFNPVQFAGGTSKYPSSAAYRILYQILYLAENLSSFSKTMTKNGLGCFLAVAESLYYPLWDRNVLNQFLNYFYVGRAFLSV